MSYGDEYFYFIKDVLGNVKEIRNRFGTKVAEYAYDAWGNCEIVYSSGPSLNSIANINPFRYRGYYYDAETGYYYCNYRYYAPELCRWISPDSIEYLDPASGLNLYVYCGNNPVMYVDPSGHSAILACILGLINGATYLSIIGGVTAGAGAFTGAFAVAEYQEAFTGNNWIIDTTGISEEWYNGLMLATAAIATAGTVASMAGVVKYQNFGNSNWYGGWREMRHHYWKHGLKEMRMSNVYSYTNSAKNVIANGKYIGGAKNAYAIRLKGNKVAYVGVGRANLLITTYSYRTYTIKKLIEFGLFVV